jgi:catalase (peroxidase I)
MDKLRKDFDEELDDAIERNKRKQQRQYDAELKRREKAIESNFKKEFNRKVKDIQRLFKHDLQLKENEVKSKLQLNFEKEKVRMETRKSEAFLKLIEQELGLKYREVEKYKLDMLRMDQLRETHTSVQEKAQKSIATRNFVTQPDADDTEEGTDLFSKIVKENRMLMSGLPKKKKVS